MRKIVRATVAAVATAVIAPVVAYAEPMVLTATQMESITAAARTPDVNINVAVNAATVTQINNAVGLALAIGPGASASSIIAQTNVNVSKQIAAR
jgi:hypothetical protein